MRWGWVGVFLATGCAATPPMMTVMTTETRRVALAPLPSPPMTLSAAPGIGLGGRVAAGLPRAQTSGGGVAFPVFQPELSGVVQLGERTWLGGRVEIATTGLGLNAPARSPRFAGNEVAFHAGIGLGHDIPLGDVMRLIGALELGLLQTTLVSTSALKTATTIDYQPHFSSALGVAAKLGTFRLYLVGGLTNHVWNEERSTLTRTCETTCVDVDTGQLATTFVATVGGGVRWQPLPALALNLEAAVPVSVYGTQLPPILGLQIRIGDFVVRPRPAPQPRYSPPPMVPAEADPPLGP
jgi:hypothetical protein